MDFKSLSSKPDDEQPPTIPQHNNTRSSPQLDKTVKHPPRSPPRVSQFSSPHDAILKQMHGSPSLAYNTNANGHSESVDADHNPQAAESLIATSASPVSTANNPTGPREILYDPFDGSPLGLLVSSHSQQQGGVPGVRMTEDGHKEEELWVHLSRVLELQNQVAKMHLEMEDVGPNVGKGNRGRARRKGKEEAGISDRADTVSGVLEGVNKGIGLEDAPEGDEEGVEVAGDEEAESKKAREAEFAGLADHFEGRNESINAVMGKLDLLSKALTEFHSLQAPTVEFPRSSSRGNSSTTPRATPPTIPRPPSRTESPSLPNASKPSAPSPNLLRPPVPGAGGPSPSTPLTSPPDNISVIPSSISRVAARPTKAKHPVSALIINGVDPSKQTHMMDSPISIGGTSLDLKPPVKEMWKRE